MPRLPTPEEVAYMQAHIEDSLVPNIIACTVICGIASMVFVALRIVSRRVAKTPLQLSDYLIMFAWLNFAVFDVCFALVVKYGGGRHILLVTDPAHARMLQVINIVNENLYCIAMAFIKFSILSMYGSIFPQRGFHWCLIAVAVFMAMWAISCCFVAIFQCTPIEYGWNPFIDGSCVNYGLLVLVAGICNIITDFVILAMPIPLVLKLNLSAQKKRMVIFTFAMGGSACIVSIIRLAFTLAVGTTADGSWDNMPAGMLSVVELMAGILAVSIPIYRPLYRHIMNKNAPDTNQGSSDSPPYVKDHVSRSVKITAGGYTKEQPTGITVTDDINIDMSTYNRKGGAWVRVYDEDESRLYQTSAKHSVSSTSMG